MIPWIDEMIKNNCIKSFEFSDFSNIIKVGNGAFSEVSKANLASMKSYVALKKIGGDNIYEELVKEVKLLRDSVHPNINRLLGMTKDSFGNYIIVLEYANEGNLRDYLKNKFSSLKWNDKIQMAFDITCGLEYLHSNGIIHRDLHPKNILVNEGKLLIADLGLSNKLEEASTNSKANELGILQYIDPQCYKKINYKKDKKSDIYSLGVLLWEITSGYSSSTSLFQIVNGRREEPIKGTPSKYIQLYQRCWDDNPNLRPDIDRVYEMLSQLKTRNLLIVGYTGSGKSTLANVLSDTADLKEGEENEHSINKAKNFQKKNFEWKNMKYCVADTIGIGNTGLAKENILRKVAEIIYLMPEGISQVLFVVDKFTEEEIKTLELFANIIFDNDNIKYITIVRTKFSNFNNERECEKDKQGLRKENQIIDKIIASCSVVYVDNPSTNFIVGDSEDEETININEKRRTKSRNLLLDHLETVCPGEHYKLKTWDELYAKIKNSPTAGNNIIREVERSLEAEAPELLNFGEIMTNATDTTSTYNLINLIKKLINYSQPSKEKFKNLLIVGRTGSGKSTLANVLSNTDYFKVGKYIKSFQKKVFDFGGTKYRVVDTAGVRDTKLSIKNVFDKMTEVIDLMPEGISRVLFVVDGTFTLEEIKIFEKVISEIGIVNYITIVRTKFSNFKNGSKCREDKEDLRGKSKLIAENIIYVDNPPINIVNDDDDDEETIRIYRKRRDRSREILLDHLEEVCKEKYYKLKMWDSLRAKFFW